MTVKNVLLFLVMLSVASVAHAQGNRVLQQYAGMKLATRRARTRGRGKGFVTPEIMISERPAEVADQA